MNYQRQQIIRPLIIPAVGRKKCTAQCGIKNGGWIYFLFL